MIQNIKAFIVVSFLIMIAFHFMKNACVGYIEKSNLNERRNTWLQISAAAFLSFNFWIYSLLLFVIVRKATRYEKNPAALFILLIFAIPLGTVMVPGFGLINYLLYLNHGRILSLFILLPAYFYLSSRKETIKFGRFATDKLLLVYFLILFSGNLRVGTFTGVLRESTYFILDVFLPYFTFSRSLRNLDQFKQVINSFVIAMTVLAIIAIFESLRHWLLYPCLNYSLNFNTLFDIYLSRDGLLRAQATSRQPIVLGYMMAIGLCMYVFLEKNIKSSLHRKLWWMILLLGLIAPVSRGPWVGAFGMMILFYLSGKNATQKLIKLFVLIPISLLLLTFIPGGERVINMIPFLGKTEKESIDYREMLFENALKVVDKNPFFGNANFLDTPEMQSMIQGQGIVDMVNTYLQILLPSGYIGLATFLAIFFVTIFSIYKSLKKLSYINLQNSELYNLGKVICIAILGSMIIIATTSSISFIAWIYWILLGIGISYTILINKIYKEEVLVMN